MKTFDKIIDSITNVMAFLCDHMLLCLVIPMALDMVLIIAYFGVGFENFFIINSTFVVNFIGLGALALYVILKGITLPIANFIYDIVETAKMKRKQVK